MELITEFIEFSTQGNTSIVDITNDIQHILNGSGLIEGTATIFGVGSTTGISTIEYEPGLVDKDIPDLYDKLAPYGPDYAHHQTWGDDNGASHVRATLQGCHIAVPFIESTLILGTWQQVIFIDFDTQPRSRKVVVQLLGKT